jgi:tetratricopeptide (TPR) repeat protein
VWELPLGGLDESGTRELAAASGAPPEAASGVYRSTRGHPLSILLLAGVPGAPGGAAGEQRFLQEEVIGRIPAGERAMLQSLSVLRRPESSAFVLGMSDDPLAFDALSALVSRSLSGLSAGRYEVHEMVRDASYARLPETTRKGLHSRAAALYMKAGGPDAGAEAVYHFMGAGEPDRAAQLLLSLGAELIDCGRLEECRSLLDLLGGSAPAESDGLSKLRRDLLAAYGDWDLGYEHLFQHSVLGRATGRRLEAPGRRTRTEKEWAAALSEHEGALRLLARMGDLPGQCEMLSSLGWIRLQRGELRQAAEAFRRVLRSAGDGGCREASLKAGTGLGHVEWLSGKGRAAATRYSATMRRLGAGDEGARIAIQNYIANLADAPAEAESSCRRLEEALALCGRGRHRRERAYTLLHLGQARSLAGKGGGAAAAMRSALADFEGIGDGHGAAFVELALSVHLLSSGEKEEARRLAGSAASRCSGPEMGAFREYAEALADMASGGTGPSARGSGAG